ncbi:hypothetical protein [Mycobacterium antarcticum]|uniref:hypothetical protein n=1 Tax=Mycolicibacterium sp. TUM20984 TaxID=3023368 RepID=UPI0024E04A7F|nr:hypothetical protein [Mycolicibacterium sp. TUM20984]
MSDDVDDTADLKAPEVAAADRQERPTSRWNGTGERVRRHPIGVAVSAGIAGLLIGGILGAGMFGGSAPEVGRAGASSHYAADGPQCLGGPPPPPPGGPGGPRGGGPGQGGPDGPAGRAAPGAPGAPAAPGVQGGPGVDRPAPDQQRGGAAPAPGPATPSTPLLPAEQPAR